MVLALGIDQRHVYGTPADKEEPLHIFGGKSARHAMQTLGTEWGRNCIGPEFWAQAWRVKAAAHLSAGIPIVADDVRFPNEVAAIRAMGGKVYCIVRSISDFERKPRHASEDFAALEHDKLIINEGSLEALHRALMRLTQPIAAE